MGVISFGEGDLGASSGSVSVGDKHTFVSSNNSLGVI